jgi:hypothetical protein
MTTSGELKKLRMLMQPKHSLDRLLAMNTSGVHDLMGSLAAHDAERIWARLFDLSQGLSASEPA